MGSLGIQTVPLPKPFESSSVDFGVEISGIDIEHIDGTCLMTIEYFSRSDPYR